MSSLDDKLYEKTVECPVCGNVFKVTAVKRKAYVVESRDTDFCVKYKDINPLFYDVWICQLCGYAAQKSTFSKITYKRSQLIKKHITPRWVAKKEPAVIEYEAAINKYKLALINAQISKAKDSEIAGICLKIAWLYRFMGKKENELHFLNHALNKYVDAFSKEKFPVENMDEATVMYLIAELYRRVGNFEESARWFNKVISQRGLPERILNLAREQWSLLREDLKNEKSESQKNNDEVSEALK